MDLLRVIMVLANGSVTMSEVGGGVDNEKLVVGSAW